jgi:hypothetical protein
MKRDGWMNQTKPVGKEAEEELCKQAKQGHGRSGR